MAWHCGSFLNGSSPFPQESTMSFERSLRERYESRCLRINEFSRTFPQELKGCPITEAVKILGDKLRDYQKQFNTAHLLALCDYFHSTFICHYKLYQYVLVQDREVSLTITHLEVCLPPQPLPLAQGVDRDVWRHKQQVAELSMVEAQKRAHVLLLKEALHLEEEHMLGKTFEDASTQQRRVLKTEELENLVKEAICIQIACLKELLQYEIQITFDILDLKLQKKTLNFNPPIPFPPLVPGQPGQEEFVKSPKANKEKKEKKAKTKAK
ncbi:uncharacterized protein C8orf74 homolog isoform X2 [Tamandua tetradactyla]|uniref:uncharacterized protein C8orf74 homolog isoform X2 n=1 Tax=Tamandua tetradactyla TaxID=48850 RepID=UPI0040542BB3